MDFFEQANAHLRDLNASERKIFEYVLRNIDESSGMSIRALAAECYVSTTTIMRFVKKLGFEGYREFSDSLRIAQYQRARSSVPSVVMRQSYGEEYVKNIAESVRVLTQEKVSQFKQVVAASSRVVCYGAGFDAEVAHYAYHFLAKLGFAASCPTEDFERAAAVRELHDGDVLYLFSYTGEAPETIDLVEKARLVCSPAVVTVTQSANNTLQGLGDIDLYVFADTLVLHDENVSSRAGMFALAELLAYELMKDSCAEEGR